MRILDPQSTARHGDVVADQTTQIAISAPELNADVDDRASFYESRSGHITLATIPFVIVLVLWYILGELDLQSLRYAVPSLTATLEALWQDWMSGSLVKHTWITFQEWAIGLFIAGSLGVVLGVFIGLVPIIERTFYGIIIFFQAMPKVALAPLWVIIFGFGIGSKIAMAAMIGFFPILVGVITGMGAVRHDEIDLLRSLNATPWQIFRMARLPRALPSTFAGFEVGAVFALIGAVVGEFVGATGGLGYLIQFRSSRLDVAGIFAALVVLSLMGLALSLTLNYLGKRLSRWEEA